MNLKQFFSTSALCAASIALLTSCSDQAKLDSEQSFSFKLSPFEHVKNASDLPHYLTRDIQDEVFYFVMPDRFANGNTENDQGSKTHPISAGGFDKTDKGMYHGGDIQGLIDKLPYLKNMGVSAIWMTPILRNQAVQEGGSGYHGYWVLDFTEIDPHLGSNDDLKAFIDAAHKQNIKVFFDIITNHTADVIKFKECHGEQGTTIPKDGRCPYISLADKAKGKTYTPVIPAGSEQSKVPAWLNNIEYYHNQGDTTFEGENSVYGDFAGLDDIDTDNSEVVELMTETFKDLVTEFKPDGFRIDTVKHVNLEFWQTFAPALVEHAKAIGIPQFFMFGEVYSFNAKELSLFTTKGKMQSVLDFAFQGAVRDVVINQKGTNILAEWLANDHLYLDNDSNANQLLNFTGNHDMGRFAHMMATSEFNYSEQEQIKRNLLASAMMYFMRGIPIVYYGDEQGFVGDGGDKDSRQDMMPSLVASYNDDDLLATDATTADDNFDVSHPFYRAFAEFANIYYQLPALRKGKQETLVAQEKPGIYAFSRIIEGVKNEQVIVVFNTSNKPASATLPVKHSNIALKYPRLLEGINNHLAAGKLTVELPALSVAVYSTHE